MINVSMTDKNGVTLATAGKYCGQNVKVTPSADILRKDEQEKSATPSTSSQDITPDAGMALSKVTVNPITPAIVGGLDAKTFAAAAAAAIEGKGVTVPDGTLLDGMAALIESIEAGGGEENLFGAYFETGSIIPASDITTDYKIQFKKNFSSISGNITDPRYIFVFWCSIPPGYTSVAIPNGSLAWIFCGRKSKNGGISYGQYLSSSGSVSNLTYEAAIGESNTDRFTLYCTSSKKLVAGYVYNWIALAPSSEGYAT